MLFFAEIALFASASGTGTHVAHHFLWYVPRSQLLVEHFETHGADKTRAIVFSHYRESVTEITQRLSMHPILKVCLSR